MSVYVYPIIIVVYTGVCMIPVHIIHNQFIVNCFLLTYTMVNVNGNPVSFSIPTVLFNLVTCQWLYIKKIYSILWFIWWWNIFSTYAIARDDHIVIINFGNKKNWQMRTVGSLVENFNKLKSICIGNVMEIVKIGKKTWRIFVICQIHKRFFDRQCFYCTVY